MQIVADHTSRSSVDRCHLRDDRWHLKATSYIQRKHWSDCFLWCFLIQKGFRIASRLNMLNNCWIMMLADACRCLPMLADACRCLPMLADACRCLPMLADACRCLPMLADACRLCLCIAWSQYTNLCHRKHSWSSSPVSPGCRDWSIARFVMTDCFPGKQVLMKTYVDLIAFRMCFLVYQLRAKMNFGICYPIISILFDFLWYLMVFDGLWWPLMVVQCSIC